jgi:hypothetical protein
MIKKEIGIDTLPNEAGRVGGTEVGIGTEEVGVGATGGAGGGGL